MAFLFSNTVNDIVRNRDFNKSIYDNSQSKIRGDKAPKELPQGSLHGITPNGTYFFCNLVYKKDIDKPGKMSIIHLIDAYANTEEHAERVRLKAQITQTCGEQVEGIALVFSNAQGS